MKAIGGDSTALNTGPWNGILTHLELNFGHRMEWIICLLHILELLPRKVLEGIDGATKSPDSYAGECDRVERV